MAQPEARTLLVGDPAFCAEARRLLPSSCPAPVDTTSVGDAAEALLAHRFALAVLDVREGAPGLPVLRRIKGAAATSMLPVLALTGAGEASVIAALEVGADHAVSAPPSPPDFAARARQLLRARVATERLEDTTQVIFALANAVEAKDAYTEGHTERVGALAVEVARLAGLAEDAQEALRQGGVLHDIGKIGIPNEILNKPGRLTDKERIVMNKHPLIGERICEPLRSLSHLLPVIRWHHERLDGTGYPDGLRGDKFPVTAQILQLSDIYDAITTDRPYHRARTRSSAVAFLHAEADKGWRDHELVKLVARAADTLGLGRLVEADIPPPPAPIGQWRTE